MPADLHVHTTFSDGTYSPEEIVKSAIEANLTAVAITDHDMIDGLIPAQAFAGQNGFGVIPGVEFTTESKNIEIHMLGFYFDQTHQKLNEVLFKLKDSRKQRVKKIISNLAKNGTILSEEKVFQIIGKASAGRPHVAQALVESGHAANIKDAFIRYLVPGKPGYVPHYKLEPIEAIKLIIEAKGVPVFAHPGTSNCDNIIPELALAGLAGLEVYYPSHGPMLEARYLELAQKFGLAITGGSDFHGSRGTREVKIGEKFTSDKDLAELGRRRSSTAISS